jgi:spore germination protein GerM
MKKKQVLALLLCLALLLAGAGCGEARTEDTGDYQLYFLAEESAGHGSALETEPFSWDKDTPPDPGELLCALLAGPTREGDVSPFPSGVTLRGWEWDGEQRGTLRVRLSEQYGGLSDISLTLADYCIVLTLSQLERVERVEISTAGYTSAYRSHQLLSAEEAVLWDSLDK